MKSTNIQRETDTLATTGLGERLARLLCWFAAFPYAAFSQISTPTDRVWVLVRGFAVIVSPLVFTLALLHNGPRIVGSAPYLYLLPPVVFCLDWFLIARSYTLAKGSAFLLLVRVAVLLISAMMALLAGLMTESDSLLQLLHRAEDEVTRHSPDARDLEARLQALRAQIGRNEKELMSHSTIEAEMLEARRLQQLECNGKSGIDPKTGVFIKGGSKCGTNATTHRINAEDAEARLAKLTHLKKENESVVGQQKKLSDEFDALLVGQRSPDSSLGTLMRALREADGGVWVHVVGTVLIIVLIEAFALIMSEIKVPQVLQTSVQFSSEVDQIRLHAWRDVAHADLAKQRALQRAQAADGLAPMEVRLAAVPQPSAERKSDTAANRRKQENPVEELA